MARAKTKPKSDYLRDTQTIDAAWAMVESLGWDIAEWDDRTQECSSMAISGDVGFPVPRGN